MLEVEHVLKTRRAEGAPTGDRELLNDMQGGGEFHSGRTPEDPAPPVDPGPQGRRLGRRVEVQLNHHYDRLNKYTKLHEFGLKHVHFLNGLPVPLRDPRTPGPAPAHPLGLGADWEKRHDVDGGGPRDSGGVESCCRRHPCEGCDPLRDRNTHTPRYRRNDS